MHTRLLGILVIFFSATPFLLSQDEEEGVRTKVIERTVDEKGNVISEKIYYQFEDSDLWSNDFPGSFDLEGLGFEELLRDRSAERSEGRPLIGVEMNFDDGVARVTSVSRGSGAEDVDVRKGDKIISVEGVAVSSFEDITEILDSKKAGDKLRVVIFRDGEEITKDIKLSSSTKRDFFFDFSEGGMDFFKDMRIDSLFEGTLGDEEGSDIIQRLFGESFKRMEELQEGEGQRPDGQRGWGLWDRGDVKNNISERATLGVFIDDIGAGVLVTEVIKDSAAEKAGLKQHDVITQVDGENISDYDDLAASIGEKQVGDVITLVIERDGKQVEIEVEL